MSYEPLHHKYRPQTFAHLVGQEAIATTLTNAIESQRIAPAYLFTGPRGTGKTSSARILAKSLNCSANSTPTATPCGVCDICKGITNGSTLDVIEIDAASNTGVDNIRELIERSQFAPVQCRYKVYVIDECLTGDSLVQTRQGLIRIDNPQLKGKEVLSYNEDKGMWEYKKVLRWLDQGERSTLVIKTKNYEIRCTDNHLLRTETGWIEAKNVREGMKILSPVNVGVEPSFTNGGLMEKSEDFPEDINFMEMPMAKNPITWMSSWNKLKLFNLSVPVGVEKNWMCPNFFNKKVEEFKVFKLTGKNILTEKDTEFGIKEPNISWLSPQFCQSINLGLSMELYSETVPSPILTKIADFPDWLGHMETSKKNGWNTKHLNCQTYDLNYELPQIKGMETYPSVVIPLAISNSKKSLTLLNQITTKKSFLLTGLTGLIQKDLPGGTWMMEHSSLAHTEALELTFVLKDTPAKKIKSLPIGSPQKDIQPQYNPIQKQSQVNSTTGSPWVLKSPENGCQTLNSIQSHQWNTSLETVVSVQAGEIAKVYDIEVEDHHNFVANGLLVHNCHMLSTAAFNALLKTLEEPPDRVVFVLATTDPQRVLPTIISRCQRFDFRRIPLDSMIKHLKYIAQQENINIADDAVFMVAQIAQGGLRDAESLLDQLSLLSGEITVEKVWDLVGAVPERDLISLLEAIDSGDTAIILDCIRNLLNRGREPLIVLQNLAGFYRDLLIAKTASTRSDLVALTQPTWEQLCQFSHRWDSTIILAGQKHLRESEAQIKHSTQPRLWLEIILLGLLPAALQKSVITQTVTVTQTPQRMVQPQPETIPFVQRSEPSNPPPNPVNSPVSQPTYTPEPQPQVKAEIPATPAEPPIVTDGNLDQIWQKVLACIELPGTQSFFRQHGRLIQFNSEVAYIKMKSEPLLKMAQTKQKLSSLEKAFQQVFGNFVKINFDSRGGNSVNQIQEVNPPSPSYPPVNNPTVSSPEVVQPPVINTQEEQQISESPNQNINKQNQIETINNYSFKPIETVETLRISPEQADTQALAIASQKLVDFFQGKMIELEEKPTSETATLLDKKADSIEINENENFIETDDLDEDNDDDF